MQTLTLTIIPILLILSILNIVVGCCLLNFNWRAALPKYSLPMNFETKSDISKHFELAVSGTETKNFDSGSGIAGTGILAGKKKRKICNSLN